MRHFALIVIFFVILLYSFEDCHGANAKKPVEFEQAQPGPKYDNPGQIRDRERGLEAKQYNKIKGAFSPPVANNDAEKKDNGVASEGKQAKGLFRPSIMGDAWNSRFKAKWHPAWMDYCDPYHCNDYHHPACGLNRQLMEFKWFQSGCHITLHNFCSTYKGARKYDTVAKRHCVKNVMHLRAGCPSACEDDSTPICGNSIVDNHLVLFKNKCWMDMANCKSSTLDEYIPVDISICKFSLAFRHIKLLTK